MINKLRDVLILGACLVLFGCNTIHGMGRDIEKAGETIEHAASK